MYIWLLNSFINKFYFISVDSLFMNKFYSLTEKQRPSIKNANCEPQNKNWIWIFKYSIDKINDILMQNSTNKMNYLH